MSPVLQNDINNALETMHQYDSTSKPLGDSGFYLKRINDEVIYFDAFDRAICVVWKSQ